MNNTLTQISAVASTIIAVALVVLTAVMVPVAWQLRNWYRRVNHLLDRVYGDITPIIKHAHEISENINFVSTSIRADVEKVNATVDTANERIRAAVTLTEDRVMEFNALLSVVQTEAEQLFVTTASAARGVRHGVRSFQQPSGMDLAFDELDDDDEVDAGDALDDNAILEGETPHGDDSNAQPAAQAVPAAPRVRPRARHRRRA